jgi:hypothetical protein
MTVDEEKRVLAGSDFIEVQGMSIARVAGHRRGACGETFESRRVRPARSSCFRVGSGMTIVPVSKSFLVSIPETRAGSIRADRQGAAPARNEPRPTSSSIGRQRERMRVDHFADHADDATSIHVGIS